MFRPVQFAVYGSCYLFQLGISNTFVSFNPQTEQFQMGHYVGGKEFLTEKQLLEMFQAHGVDFILEANKCSYINNMISLGNIIWLQTHQGGKNYLTKVEGGQRSQPNSHTGRLFPLFPMQKAMTVYYYISHPIVFRNIPKM